VHAYGAASLGDACIVDGQKEEEMVCGKAQKIMDRKAHIMQIINSKRVVWKTLGSKCDVDISTCLTLEEIMIKIQQILKEGLDEIHDFGGRTVFDLNTFDYAFEMLIKNSQKITGNHKLHWADLFMQKNSSLVLFESLELFCKGSEIESQNKYDFWHLMPMSTQTIPSVK